MYRVVPVAGRTRSKRGMVDGSGLPMGQKKKNKRVHGPEKVIVLEDDEVANVRVEPGSGGASSSSSSSGARALNPENERVSERFGGHADDPIEICDSDDDDDDEGLRDSVSVDNKVENFDNDDDYGLVPEKPIVLKFDYSDGERGSEKEHTESGSSDDECDSLLSLTESEDDDVSTSDEDFRVDDDGVENAYYSSSDDSDSSACDDKRVRKVASETENSGAVCKRKGGMKDSEKVEKWIGANCTSAITSRFVIYEEEARDAAQKHEVKRLKSVNADAEGVFGGLWENAGCSMHSEEHRKKRDRGHQIVSLQNETGDSTVIKKGEKSYNANANDNDSVILDENEGEEHCPIEGTSARGVSFLPKSQEKIGADSAKVVMKKKDRKGRIHRYGFSSNKREKNELYEVLRMPSRTKDQYFDFFTECFWGKNGSVKDDSNQLEEKHDDVDLGQTQPLAPIETVPLNGNFLKKEPIEKSEFEKELDILWGEMDLLLQVEEIGSQIDNAGTVEARENEENPVPQCKHDNVFNEEIGIYCSWCGWIATEIKYITPPFVDSERYSREALSSGGKTTQFDEGLFNDSGDDSNAVWSHNEGSVWDLIPDIKESLYPHQQEGFEFIWTTLAGTTDLAKLKRVDPHSEGGCIISHAPGTGKTRLTMVFLQTYLRLFPKCLPIIIAPANILLTWEDELRKWNIGIPFHNLNNGELSGNEKDFNEVEWSGNQRQNKDAIRMVKLCSWYKETSILLISYHLYEKLARGMSEGGDGEKENKNRKMKKEKKRSKCIETAMGKVLRDYPGLLILDEGHTPRNQRSYIWKVISESRSQKRVLLSGTPFQNNFLELYNILSLMKPSFQDSITQELKKFCQSRLRQERKASKEVSWEPVSSANHAGEKINQLKLMMNPFVHVHKGSILQKNLLGLRDCVLFLKPDSLQQETLDSIDCSQNVLNFEHKLALVSVHPSLFLDCSLSEKEESVLNKDQLEKLRLNPYGGVKTKFLLELVRLCDAINEKVLVFSQFIDTLCLVKDQLESAFNWSVGTEVLYMNGKLDQKQKQSLIHSFNDTNSQAKVLLASIKASSEGINLTGASRVVLLDVVWNPSVERQAISRAYRLGQKKVVYTYHLLAQGTPECNKYCKQAEKDRLSELVFSNKNAKSDKLNSSGVVLEDAVLDLMVQHEKLKDMFGELLVQPKERDLENLGP